MKHLLYCIARTRETGKTSCPLGVERQPVSLVTGGSLSAVVSGIAGVDLAPDLPRILAYEKVVEAFHRVDTVIPMRYGCLLEEKSAIIHFLEERRPLYEGLLEEMDGCEEMGIRLIPEGADAVAMRAVHPYSPRKGSAREILRTGDSPFPCQSGRAYLAAQKERYAAQDRLTHEEEETAARVCAHLSGLFVRRKIESSELSGNRLISLYFLVPRGSVQAFRMAFRHICSLKMPRILLSGPWPPYNFARTDRSKPRGDLSLGA